MSGEITAAIDVTAFREPKPRYRRVVDRYECPMCDARLGELSWHGSEQTFRIYTDDEQIQPPSQLRRRTFHPCGCVDFALTPLPVPAGLGEVEKP